MWHIYSHTSRPAGQLDGQSSFNTKFHEFPRFFGLFSVFLTRFTSSFFNVLFINFDLSGMKWLNVTKSVTVNSRLVCVLESNKQMEDIRYHREATDFRFMSHKPCKLFIKLINKTFSLSENCLVLLMITFLTQFV